MCGIDKLFNMCDVCAWLVHEICSAWVFGFLVIATKVNNGRFLILLKTMRLLHASMCLRNTSFRPYHCHTVSSEDAVIGTRSGDGDINS